MHSPRDHVALTSSRHFTIRGADGTDFEGGTYHGRILLPPEYPFKPPHILLLTPSGRFETNTKICLSFSAYHPELWQPAWGIRLILEALISFLPTPADGAIGALDWSAEERKKLATKSVSFVCPLCGPIKELIPKVEKKECIGKSRFEKEIAELQRMQTVNHNTENTDETGDAVEDKTGNSVDQENVDAEMDASPSQEPVLVEDAEPEEQRETICQPVTTLSIEEAVVAPPAPAVVHATRDAPEAFYPQRPRPPSLPRGTSCFEMSLNAMVIGLSVASFFLLQRLHSVLLELQELTANEFR